MTILVKGVKSTNSMNDHHYKSFSVLSITILVLLGLTLFPPIFDLDLLNHEVFLVGQDILGRKLAYL